MSVRDIEAAARAIADADALLVTAGAGMGVDSGLPDFRGKEGFWKAYPALGRAGLGFTSIANPAAFESNPKRAWGFYGHRLQLYRATLPHAGFGILQEMARHMANGLFVVTSNVDGQFQKAGYDPQRVAEVHGSIHHLQCRHGCMGDIWPAKGFDPLVDELQCELVSDFPRCPHCGEIARPNILMFGDWEWLNFRAEIQEAAMNSWLRKAGRLVVIEVGAGTDIPTVRNLGETVDGTLIRINPREPGVAGEKSISIMSGGLVGIREIFARLQGG